jgi:clostripain
MELRGDGSKGSAIAYQPRGGTNVDLYDLCRRIAACDRLPETVRKSSQNVMAALEQLMLASFGMSAYSGFESGKHGVYIVLPRDKAGFTKHGSWYTPSEAADKATGRLAFLRDGATPNNRTVENWYELLASWFNEPQDRGEPPVARP